MNADCFMYNHVKECRCPPGFTGNQDVECFRRKFFFKILLMIIYPRKILISITSVLFLFTVPTSCISNTDCPQNQQCKESICMPGCQVDNDCALNEKCLKGNCILTCRVDNDCFLGHICLHNMCIFGCHNDDDCSASESCRNNRCTNPCLENPCGPNAHCTVSNHRASCACGSGFVPNPSAKVACIRVPASPCTENKACPFGNICYDGVCQTVCSSDQGCLSNERCDLTNGICKPLCRRDDDCKNGEICEGLLCIIGCRGNSGCTSNRECLNNKCVDPCISPTACGTNAKCDVINHQKTCSCPAPLIGDPLESCKHPIKSCYSDSECTNGRVCYGGFCQDMCRTDKNCLSDERCVKGVCKTICNSDAKCGTNQICENRLCEIGCRSDSVCKSNEACLNNRCQNPCAGFTACGTCAECSVTNHVAQCSCPANFLGNPLVSCMQPVSRCDGTCECDEIGYCLKLCRSEKDCSCGEICQSGKCRTKCSGRNSCAQGLICKNSACVPGCFVHNDCPPSELCINRQCQNPCKKKNACGRNALCKVSDRSKVCLCPDGYKGNPHRTCIPYECRKDEDCDVNKKCSTDGACKNPCLEQAACGINAQCRVIDRNAQCSCPPGYIGNALIECKQIGQEECLKNPCGENTKCRDIIGGYECSCLPGCVGDPQRGCVCDGQLVNLCKGKLCGVNADCRVVNGKTAQCYCPSQYPKGDPTIECK